MADPTDGPARLTILEEKVDVEGAREAPVRRRMSHEEWCHTARERFGDDSMEWRFQCPRCGTVQCGKDLVAAGVARDKLDYVLAFSCIGRFDPARGCNWTLGGLFAIHTTEVVFEGGVQPVFEFAGEDSP